MRKRIAAGVLAAATGMGLLGLVPQQARAADAPATQPAGEHAQVPVREVVLFSSGVGYFEHFGTVTGNGTTELNFKSQQINDILKSLVLQDLDKGRVGVITYPSQDPVAKTLRSFQVDITANPSLPDLLNQLRGARVTVRLAGDSVGGTVLGVERKRRPVGDRDDKKVVDVWVLNLITGAGIRPVPLDDVRDVQIEDPKLRDELQRALAALASARDQDKKPVTISFQGRGERRVRLGYVVEAPVWKTSYRLLLDGDPVAGPGKAEGDKGDKDGKDNTTDSPLPKPKDAQGGANPAGGGAAGNNLQGWAIVENQTDNDWNDVQLSLVSGRPISFIQDLYQPLYVPRPVVQPELYASLRPQTYDAGMDASKRDMAAFGVPGATAAAPAAPGAAAPRGGRQAQDEARKQLESEQLGRAVHNREALSAANGKSSLGLMDAASSVSSAASAAKLGELFQYTVGSVSLPRQKSAMIPIVTDPVEVERVSIYNQAVLAKNPLYGARLKNTTGKHLLQGPVTALQGGSYAGDAKIDDLPPGQERLISYGIDLQVLVQAQNGKHESAIQTGKIVKGVLQLTHKDVASQEYVAENKSDRAKTLIVEHARRGGNWKLVEPAKAGETTDALYRFKDRIEPNKPKKLTVREEAVRGEALAILPMDLAQLRWYAVNAPLPDDVKKALGQAAELRRVLADTERQIAERQQRIGQISQEQTRLRENMKTVAQNTEYYTRLLKKLNDQETQIEQLQQEVDGLQKQRDQQRKAMEDFVGGLNVG